MARNRPPLTRQFCETAKPPVKGNKIYRCGQTKGLGLRVTANGRRSFVFSYSAPSGQERRMTIGAFGPWTVGAARKRADELRRTVDMGHDPFESQEGSSGSTRRPELWAWYTHGPLKDLSPAKSAGYRSCLAKQIEPTLGPSTKLEMITRADIQRLVDRTTELTGPVSANRVHSYIRKS